MDNIEFNDKVDTNKREIKIEDAMDNVKAGNGAICQMKEMPDGTKRYFNVYGDVHDGWDHILNIFMDSSSFSPLIQAAVHGKLKKSERKENNEYKVSQTTIDYTDKAITWLFINTEEKIFLEAYQRDQKKGFYDPQIDEAWEKTNGSIEINGEKLKENKYLYYVFLFASLRNHLEAEGFIDQLRELNKYSGAGVLVSAEDEDHITCKIVQGKERPDLPCEVFLMGTITCRPYLDEILAGARISKMSFEDRIKEAEAGDTDAMEALAKAYLEGDDVPQDLEKSFYWWKKLAETGNAMAQFNTGLYYAKGCGVERDFTKAAEWMQRSAENGDEDAANAVKAYKAADDNLRKAQAGDVAAMAELAKLYTQMGDSLQQLDVDTDYQEAFRWAKESANQGNPEGMYVLALCYEHGRGAEYNSEEAIKAYKQAADKGHAPSQWNLACHYLRGFGDHVEEGLMLAYQAADQGYELAIKGLEQSGNTVEKLNDYYASEETRVSLEGTQYEGRADRCERIHSGDELTYKMAKDKMGKDALELFFRGGSVGLVYQHTVGKIIALLKLNRAKLKVTVRNCIPKSKRGTRARNADVTLNMILTEIKPETPEERAKRLAKEEADRKAAEEKRRQEAEERKKAEEEARRKAEEERKKREEALKKYNEEHDIWQSQCDALREKRDSYVVEKLAEERKAIEDQIGKEKDTSVSSAQSIITEQSKRKDDAERLLGSLGMFKFGEKKTQKAIIEDAGNRISEAKAAIAKAEELYKSKKASVEVDARRKEGTFRNEAEKLYPFPAEPSKPF